MPRLLPAVTVALGLLLAGCGSSSSAGAGADAPTSSPSTQPAVDVSVSDCGSSWQPTGAGAQELMLHNADAHAGEVQVVGRGAGAGLVYADVEPFGPGTTVDVHVSLKAGRYALACLMEDSAPATGPTRTITGAGPGAPGVRILTQSQLVPSAIAYQSWVRRHLAPLVRHTGRLRDLVDAGDLTGARSAWLTAHVDYQRLGAAYDAFGDLGDAIDGLPAGIPGGTSNPRWTGFHRVERDLWAGASAAALRSDTAALARAVGQLRTQLGTTHLDPLTLTLRAHEIDENALQFQLTGQDDFGSHTDLQSVRAELVGTGAVLHALARPIDQRVAGAGKIRAALRRTLATFTRATRSGAHVAVDRLPRLERERLDASLSLLTQRLAAIPAALEPRLTVGSQTLHGSSQSSGEGGGR
jgi:iron uptake system component EfeO